MLQEDRQRLRRRVLVIYNDFARDHSEDLGIDGKIILEWILGKWVW